MKDVSALLWVDEDKEPSGGAHDKMQPYLALMNHDVPHDYIVCEHSGHGLQNDNKQYIEYMRKIVKYLDTYMPVQ